MLEDNVTSYVKHTVIFKRCSFSLSLLNSLDFLKLPSIFIGTSPAQGGRDWSGINLTCLQFFSYLELSFTVPRLYCLFFGPSDIYFNFTGYWILFHPSPNLKCPQGPLLQEDSSSSKGCVFPFTAFLYRWESSEVTGMLFKNTQFSFVCSNFLSCGHIQIFQNASNVGNLQRTPESFIATFMII